MGVLLVNKLLIQLLAFLDNIILLQQLLEREVLRIEQILDRGGVRKAHTPEHGCGAGVGADVSAPENGLAGG